MADKPQVLLVGGGGIGTMAALNIERGGLAEVTAVLRSNFEIVSRKGFSIKSCDHGNLENWRPTQSQSAAHRCLAVTASDNPETDISGVLNSVPSISDTSPIVRYDYIVCCTKNIPDAGPGLPDIIAPAVSPAHTVIVLIQNGLNIQLPFFRRFPSNIVLSGHDLLHVGAFQSPKLSKEEQHRAAQHFVRIYSAGGTNTCLYMPDVDFDRWSKLVYNASFNPICALTGLNTSELQMTGRTMDTMVVPAMREVLAVAAAAGHNIPEDIIEKTIQLNPMEENIKPSMQVDFEKGNLIEHENILGEVVREAQRHGVDTPILNVLYEICCAHQWRFRKAALNEPRGTR
ncbi:uncharacterized protein ColLi_08713 [Colletotrichum liriopes]|uniref:2-dehydropantoate 2-reductase n=1 Tax=Colletotrichum liriopes TaxID=708192 RepID=A0AA37GSA1_9PEZI|nr:uncharacterized protein ColLi_08713 [Colletotrichum liriopes]